MNEPEVQSRSTDSSVKTAKPEGRSGVMSRLWSGRGMKILVINTGSSSIKHRLYEMEGEKTLTLARGLIERIGEPEGRESCELTRPGRDSPLCVVERGPIKDHQEAMHRILGRLTDPAGGAIGEASEVQAVGHRVVHGGEEFREPALVDEKVIAAVKRNFALAPVHNPANLLGIELARQFFAGAVQVAVFDTAFHQTLPPRAFVYAVPFELYQERRIRRYGFHGTSHQFAAKRAARFLGRPLSELNLLTLHLGNGSSITAIERGKSVDTSMGLTPLEGLVMGARSGDLDPAIIFRLAGQGVSLSEIETMLNQKSGLKGLAGANDMRELLARKSAGDERADLALEVYAYRIRKYIGAYLAALGEAHAIVFTAGVGENAPEVRAAALCGLERLGVILDPARNRQPGDREFEISADHSPIKVLVIPANEELEIAEQTLELVTSRPPRA